MAGSLTEVCIARRASIPRRILVLTDRTHPFNFSIWMCVYNKKERHQNRKHLPAFPPLSLPSPHLSRPSTPLPYFPVLLGCQLGARWCLASSLTCDFNMIKNYTHDWLLLVAAYHASSPDSGKPA